MKNILYMIAAIMLTAATLNAQSDEFFEPKTTISGYGELHYNSVGVGDAERNETLDFHRFVLFVGHAFNEKWSLKSEIELEHNYIRGGQGELQLEQAYVNYHHADYLGLQFGVLLAASGLINEFHEPTNFFGVERPEYAAMIIPTTWFGNGIGLYGQYKGFDYRLLAIEGLDPDKISYSSGIRGARQKGYMADASRMLYNGRVDYTGISGLKIGASFAYNLAEGDTNNVAIFMFEGHAKYEKNGIIAVAEFGNISYDKGILKNSRGYYVDLGYDLSKVVNFGAQLAPFVRYSQVNPAHETLAGGNADKQYGFNQIMFGLNYKPNGNVIFKIDYNQKERLSDNLKTTSLNLGVGYIF
ncbi:MAG: porin family protein [Ignavibacteriaceae bacterium]|nr:porin family protein [Ignavibacteriaceae bacterium]